MLTALIDGDIYAYKASSSVEVDTHWGNGLWTLHADEDEAIRMFDNLMSDIKAVLKADRLIVCLSDSASNFRKSILPTYKSNRNETRKPVCYKALREHIAENYETYLRPTLEADDILGILMTNPKIVKGDRVMVSEDKDLRTVPGFLYNTKKPDAGVIQITEQEADRYHMYQTLIGDVTDGYTGCPGMGADRGGAAIESMTKLVPYEYTLTRGVRKGQVETRYREEPTDNLWDVVMSRYTAAGLSEEFALEQARVARILRSSDYDFTKKEPILWKPQ